MKVNIPSLYYSIVNNKLITTQMGILSTLSIRCVNHGDFHYHTPSKKAELLTDHFDLFEGGAPISLLPVIPWI